MFTITFSNQSLVKLITYVILLYLICLPYCEIKAQQNDIARLEAVKKLSLQYPDSAFVILKFLNTKAIENKKDLISGICFQYMGQICFNQGHYAQAIDFHQHAEKLFRQANNREMLAKNLNEMGVLYYYNRQKQKARSLYNQALNIYGQLHNESGEAETFGNLGHLYEKHQQYDSAFYYQNLALSHYNKISDKQGIAKIYENLGSIYEDLAKYDSSYSCFNKAILLYNQSHDQVASIEVINNLGDILRKTGRYRESIKQSRRALILSAQTSNIYQLAASCRDIGKAYQLMHQMDSAYHYLELSRMYSLEVYSREGIKQTAFLQVLYDMDRKSDEIARLENTRKTNRIIAASAVIIVILLVISGGLVFSRQRLKIKDQRVLGERNREFFETQRNLMEAELKNKQLEEESLKQDLELKSKELTTHTLNLIQNNQLLEDMRSKLQEMVKDDKRDQKKQLQKLIIQINRSFNQDQHWKEFTHVFEQVHQRFFDNLRKHGKDLTSGDMRLIALLKMNLDSKDMATLLGISADSLRVSRYRLRKKLNIGQGENLSTFIQAL